MPTKRHLISPQAKRDLNDIWFYIAKKSVVDYADNVIDDLEDGITAVAAMPGMGRNRIEFTHNQSLLFWPVGHYLIVYRADRNPIEIVRVLHTARNIPALLDDL